MQLQRTLKADEEEIAGLETHLESAQKKFQTMFEDYQKRTDMMEVRIVYSIINYSSTRRKPPDNELHECVLYTNIIFFGFCIV